MRNLAKKLALRLRCLAAVEVSKRFSDGVEFATGVLQVDDE
jgi:hypothetical protein